MSRIASPSLVAALLLLVAGCASHDTASDQAGPGIHRGTSAKFDAHHDFVVDIPEGAKQVDIWFATPHPKDPMQRVSDWRVESEHPHRFVEDNHGNRYLYMRLESPEPGKLDVGTSFTVTRYEVRADVDPTHTRPHTEAELARLAPYLKGSSQSVIDADARAMALRVVGSERNPIRASRKIYDAILDHVEYHVKDPKPDAQKTMNSTGTGSSQQCFSTGTGNCTDFHSLYAAVSRAAGIPTRAVYGSFFKGPLDGQDKDQSYHCWIEFHAPEIGWIPLDVAVADIFVRDFEANEHSGPRADLTVADGYKGPDAAMVDYYFGNLDERRVTWHWGRDLVMDPPQKGKPLLWNPKAYAEVDGEPAGIVSRKLTFHQKP